MIWLWSNIFCKAVLKCFCCCNNGVLCRLHLGVHPTGGTPGPHYLQKSRWSWHKVWPISSCQCLWPLDPFETHQLLILSVFCRMPDPDFSVSDVKLFVGKNRSFCSSVTLSCLQHLYYLWLLLTFPPLPLLWQAVAGWWMWWMWPLKKASRCQWVSGGDTTRRRLLNVKSCTMWSAWSSVTQN